MTSISIRSSRRNFGRALLTLTLAITVLTTCPSHSLAVRPQPQRDPDITFLVTNNSGNSIEQLDYLGNDVGTFAQNILPGNIILNVPYGIATDAAGNVFVSNFGSKTIKRFSPGGGVTTLADAQTVIPGSAGFNPIGMVFDSAGNLYVADAVLNQPGQILKFTSDGAGGFTPSVFFATNPLILAQPFGLAFDHSGNLYVSNSDTNSNSIARITPAGVGSIFAKNDILAKPTGLAFDSADNLYVASFNNDLIEAIDPGGNLSTYAQDDVNAPTFLNGPIGLAMDQFDNLYAVNHNSASITEFTSVGMFGFASDPGDGSVLSGPAFVSIASTSSLTAVPEPASAMLAGGAVLMVAVYCLRRKKAMRGKTAC